MTSSVKLLYTYDWLDKHVDADKQLVFKVNNNIWIKSNPLQVY